MERGSTGRSGRIALLAVLGVAVAIAAPLYASGGGGKQVKKAKATLVDANGNTVGEVKLKQERDAVEVKARFDSVPTGFHGFHVHSIGNCTAPAFTSAGGHLNPTSANHGAHAGDMPVLYALADGSAETTFETDRFTVDELFDADGSALVVHASPDNYANIPAAYGAPNATTLATGDAGGRYACGVVEKKGQEED
jgi:Cu-Zn family superoxide dismutase